MEEKKAQIEKLVEEAQTDESMFGVMIDRINAVVTSFNAEKHEEAIEKGLNTLDLMDEPRKKFLTVTLGYSLAASIEVIGGIAASGVDTKEADDIISEAADNFIDAEFEKVDKGIAKLPEMITDLKGKQQAAAEQQIAALKELITGIKEIQANVSEAEGHLAKAEAALTAKDFTAITEAVEDGTASAEQSKADRIEAVKGEMDNAKSLIDEAQVIGVNIEEPVKLFSEAEKAFKSEDYNKAAESAKQAEDLASELEEAQIKKVEEIKARRQTRGQSTASEQEAQPAAGAPLPPADEEDKPSTDFEIVKPAMGGLGGDDDDDADAFDDKEPALRSGVDDGPLLTGNETQAAEPAQDDAQDEKGTDQIAKEEAEKVSLEEALAQQSPEGGTESVDMGDALGDMGAALADAVGVADSPALDPADEKPADKVDPTEPALCGTCGNLMRYIEQYERNYCDTCKAYK